MTVKTRQRIKYVNKLPQTADKQIVIRFDDIHQYPMPKIMTEFLKYLNEQ